VESQAGESLRVFFDADVLIAGAASTSGASHVLLHLAELGLVAGITSEQAVHEVERNLLSKLPAALPAFRAIVSAALQIVSGPGTDALRAFRGQAHESDLPILAAARLNACKYLVTFNVRHYRPAGAGLRATAPGPLVERIRRALIEVE
jgi:predicted nucleic acid-binding protein